MSLLRRQSRRALPITINDDEGMSQRNRTWVQSLPPRSQTSTRKREEESLQGHPAMGTHHLIVLVTIVYAILFLGRAEFGYIPGRRCIGTGNDLVPIDHNQVTLVTAYFDIPSKRPSSEYLPWIQHMMSLQDNMVVFTSSDQVNIIKKLRGNRPSKVISIELNETALVEKYGMDFWARQNSLEPGMEKYLHSKELYIVWNEKGHFLEKVITTNPFDSTFFAWVDMGYLRDDLLDFKRMIRYLPTKLTNDQIMLLDVRRLVQNNYVGGGFIGGYKQGLLKWTKTYYDLLDANRDRFLGKDQPWMFQNCVNQPNVCVLVPAINRYGDAWFYMAPYLHGVQFFGTTDHLWRVWKRSTLGRLLLWMTTPILDLSELASKHKAAIGETLDSSADEASS